MKYTSKLIKEIISSPSAEKGLDYITPIYQKAYTALWLMQAIGLQTDIIIKLIEEYKLQIIPQTATWALEYFEEEYGIPTNKKLSIEERRKAILFKIRTRAPINPVKLSNILSETTNKNITIKENTGKNRFSAETLDILNKEQITKIRNTIDKYKPAHLIYLINFILKESFANKNDLMIKNLKLSGFLENFKDRQLIQSKQLIISGSFKENEKLSASITIDTLWYLDGVYKIDKTRQLNADIVKIKL